MDSADHRRELDRLTARFEADLRRQKAEVVFWYEAELKSKQQEIATLQNTVNRLKEEAAASKIQCDEQIAQAVSRKQSEHESALASLNAKHKEESAKHTATVKQLNEEVSRLKQRLDEAGKQHGSLVSVVQTALSQMLSGSQQLVVDISAACRQITNDVNQREAECVERTDSGSGTVAGTTAQAVQH